MNQKQKMGCMSCLGAIGAIVLLVMVVGYVGDREKTAFASLPLASRLDVLWGRSDWDGVISTLEAAKTTPEWSDAMAEKLAAAQTNKTAASQPKNAANLEAAATEVAEMLTAANTSAGVNFFARTVIKQGGLRLEVTVSDLWYVAPAHQKERLIETLADGYAVLATKHHLRGDTPGAGNYPTTSLVDSHGKEVAYKSTWGVEVKR